MKKTLSVFVAVLLLLSIIPGALGLPALASNTNEINVSESLYKDSKMINKLYIPKSVVAAFVNAKAKGWDVVPLIVHLKEGYTARDLSREGFIVGKTFDPINLAAVAVDVDNMKLLYKSKAIDRVWLDQIYKIVPPKPQRGSDLRPNYFFSNLTLSAEEAQGLANVSVESTYTKAMWELGFDGKNATIAVIDTGVDPGHPDLQWTTDGKPKIVDYVDLTDTWLLSYYFGIPYKPASGWFDTSTEVEATDGTVTYMNKTFELPDDASSKSGVYHIGHVEELGVELDGDFYDDSGYGASIYDGFHHDPWAGAILVVDNQTAGVYDLVYVDTDDDGSFADEKPLTLYRANPDPENVGAWVWYPEYGIKKSFVVSELSEDGAWVVLGYDMGDHGTHVAGTIAANGWIKGMAPGAQLMVIKVGADYAGYILTSYLVNAFVYAALGADGVPNTGDEADAVSMSIGGLPQFQVGMEADDLVLNWVADQFDVPFSISAGNEGPGINSVGSPSVAFNAISVGAAMEKLRMEWLNENVVNTPEYQYICDACNISTIAGFPIDEITDYATITTFSSRGPNEIGQFKPTLVAPGANVMSAMPLEELFFVNPVPYQYMSGTSMAAPHVGGALALLIGAYKDTYGVRPTPDMVKDALIEGAIPLNQSLIDAGAGFLNVTAAWEVLRSYDTVEESPLVYSGYYARDSAAREVYQEGDNAYGYPYMYFPVGWDYNLTSGMISYLMALGMAGRYDEPIGFITIYNPSDQDITLDLTVTGELAPYIFMNDNLTQLLSGIAKTSIEVPAGDINVVFFTTPYAFEGVTLSPGVHEAMIIGDDPNTKIIDMRAPITIVVPYEFTAENNYTISKEIHVKAGEEGNYNLNRLLFNVPNDAQLLDIEVYQKNGADVVSFVFDPDGITNMAIGTVGPDMPSSDDCDYYWDMGGPRDRRYIYSPAGGIWEIFSSNNYYNAWTWDVYAPPLPADIDFNVTLYGVESQDEVPYVPYNVGPVVFNYTITNLYAPIDAMVFATGVGPYNASIKNVADGGWYVEEFTVPAETYFLHIGISNPRDVAADLDLYVIGPDGTVYEDQIGPTSDEALELDNPEPGIYTIMVYGYDVPSGTTDFMLTKYALRDGYFFSYEPTAYIETGATANVTLLLNASGEVYPGVNIGFIDFLLNDPYFEDGQVEVLEVPVFIKVGGSSFAVGLEKTKVPIGDSPKIIVKDALTGTSVPGAQVYINGSYYGVTDENGELKLDVETSMLKLGEHSFEVEVMREGYTTYSGKLTYKVIDNTNQPITTPSADVVLGSGEITNFESHPGRIEFTITGDSGDTATVMVILPVDTYYIKVNGDHIVEYYIEKGKYAQYLFVTVEFASSVTVTIAYTTISETKKTLNTLNSLYYNYYKVGLTYFEKLYKEALNLGVDNETIKMATDLNQTAGEYYKQAEELAKGDIPRMIRIGNPRLLVYLRKAYLDLREAIILLRNAINEFESS